MHCCAMESDACSLKVNVECTSVIFLGLMLDVLLCHRYSLLESDARSLKVNLALRM